MLMYRTENIYDSNRQPEQRCCIRSISLHNFFERTSMDILQHHNVKAVCFLKLKGFDYTTQLCAELLQQPVLLLEPHYCFRVGKFSLQYF
ncbi:hypothetical protein D3C80_1950800 [compost metagenome]